MERHEYPKMKYHRSGRTGIAESAEHEASAFSDPAEWGDQVFPPEEQPEEVAAEETPAECPRCAELTAKFDESWAGAQKVIDELRKENAKLTKSLAAAEKKAAKPSGKEKPAAEQKPQEPAAE